MNFTSQNSVNTIRQSCILRYMILEICNPPKWFGLPFPLPSFFSSWTNGPQELEKQLTLYPKNENGQRCDEFHITEFGQHNSTIVYSKIYDFRNMQPPEMIRTAFSSSVFLLLLDQWTTRIKKKKTLYPKNENGQRWDEIYITESAQHFLIIVFYNIYNFRKMQPPEMIRTSFSSSVFLLLLDQ